MRDIEFREWDGKRWYYWGYGIMGDGIYTGPTNPSFPSYQYTGLKDKNGVKIFEGDIIGPISPSGFSGPNILNGYYVEVKFERAGFCPFSVAGWEIVPEPDEVEVIGNIHEHPELLK